MIGVQTCALPILRPYPFSPTVVVDIEPVISSVIDLLDCHKSQFYEWLPYNFQVEDQVPDDAAARRDWMGEWYRRRIEPRADRFRDQLIATYGKEEGGRVRFVEAFEPCEYGSPLTEENRRKLFPFLP